MVSIWIKMLNILLKNLNEKYCLLKWCVVQLTVEYEPLNTLKCNHQQLSTFNTNLDYSIHLLTANTTWSSTLSITPPPPLTTTNSSISNSLLSRTHTKLRNLCLAASMTLEYCPQKSKAFVVSFLLSQINYTRHFRKCWTNHSIYFNFITMEYSIHYFSLPFGAFNAINFKTVTVFKSNLYETDFKN